MQVATWERGRCHPLLPPFLVQCDPCIDIGRMMPATIIMHVLPHQPLLHKSFYKTVFFINKGGNEVQPSRLMPMINGDGLF